MNEPTPTDRPVSFSIVPDEDELRSLDRDLNFYPADPAAAEHLSADDVRGFNQRGYLPARAFFPPDEADDIRAYFDALLDRVTAAGGDSYSISSAHLKHGRVWDLLTDDRIVDAVSDLLGPNVVGWGSHFFCKMPGDGKSVAWHQDASYWPLSPSKAVTVWLAIDDADPGNGCMKFVAGSHRHGHMTYRPSTSDDHNVLSQTIDDVEQYGDVVWNPVPAGHASMHADLLLHGSDPNDSDRRRCALTLRYAAADVRAGLGWNEKGVVVRGENVDGHWADVPRPADD